jgi:hypothetical protein
MAKRPPKRQGPTPVESIRHKDARVNIPTEELRDFVAEDEKVGVIRLHGHLPKGGYDVPTDGRAPEAPATPGSVMMTSARRRSGSCSTRAS